MAENFELSIEPATDSRSPLIRFKGVLKSVTGETRQSDFGERAIGKFDFTDVVVMESSEPYPFPIATIEITYKKRKGTAWDVFSISAHKILQVNNINLLVGKMQEWYYGPCVFNGPLNNPDGTPMLDAKGKQVWGEVPSNAWQVVSVDGYNSTDSSNGSGNLFEALAVVAAGKTDEQFYTALMNDSSLKAYPGFSDAVKAALDRKLLDTMVAGGVIKKEGELWTKV